MLNQYLEKSIYMKFQIQKKKNLKINFQYHFKCNICNIKKF